MQLITSTCDRAPRTDACVAPPSSIICPVGSGRDLFSCRNQGHGMQPRAATCKAASATVSRILRRSYMPCPYLALVHLWTHTAQVISVLLTVVQCQISVRSQTCWLALPALGPGTTTCDATPQLSRSRSACAGWHSSQQPCSQSAFHTQSCERSPSREQLQPVMRHRRALQQRSQAHRRTGE